MKRRNKKWHTVRKKVRLVPFVTATSCSGNEKLGHSFVDECISCTGNYEIILASREQRLSCLLRQGSKVEYLSSAEKKKFCTSYLHTSALILYRLKQKLQRVKWEISLITNDTKVASLTPHVYTS